jgi:secreted trypsin-like serine protease
VLTAAHCVNAAPNVFVLSNTNDLSSGGTSISIVQQIPHPNYNAATDAYDFGLIQLASAAPVATMSMVTQADATLTQAGDWATVIGWGHTQEGCCPSNLLRQVSVPIVDDATCNSQYGGGIDFVSMLCAGDAGIDSCQGDSGGPLMVQRPSGQWIQAGVVSTGFGCARPNFPGIYAEVLAGLNWINQMIGSTPGPTPSPTPFPFPTSPPSPKPTATPGATSTPNPTAPPTAPPGPTTPPSVPVKPTPPGSGPTPTPAPTGQPAPTPTPTPTPTPFNPCALKPGACQ